MATGRQEVMQRSLWKLTRRSLRPGNACTHLPARPSIPSFMNSLTCLPLQHWPRVLSVACAGGEDGDGRLALCLLACPDFHLLGLAGSGGRFTLQGTTGRRRNGIAAPKHPNTAGGRAVWRPRRPRVRAAPPLTFGNRWVSGRVFPRARPGRSVQDPCHTRTPCLMQAHPPSLPLLLPGPLPLPGRPFKICTSLPPSLQGTRSSSPRGCLKPQTAPDPAYTVFPMHTTYGNL